MNYKKFEINVPGKLYIYNKFEKEWIVEIDADIKQFELCVDHEHSFSFTPSETTTKESLLNLNILQNYGTLTQLNLEDSGNSIELDLIGWEMLKDVEDLRITYLEGFKSYKFIEEMPDLKSVTAFDSEITDEGLNALQNAKKLTYLGLDNTTMLTKKGFEYLKSLDIQILELYGCDYVDDDFVDFIVESFPNLTWIDLMTCKNITDESIKKLATMKNLVEVCLTDCPQLTAKSVGYLADLKSLKFLSWGIYSEEPRRLTTNEEIQKFCEYENLVQLVLSGITESSINSILELKRLKSLKHLFLDFDRKIDQCHKVQIIETFPECDVEIYPIN